MSQSQVNKPVLALDFDGVLLSYKDGVCEGRPTTGAIDFLDEVTKSFHVSVYSCRNGVPSNVDGIKNWLIQIITESRPTVRAHEILRNMSISVVKPEAHVYLDDKAITFEGTWPSIETLLKFKPWWDRK